MAALSWIFGMLHIFLMVLEGIAEHSICRNSSDQEEEREVAADILQEIYQTCYDRGDGSFHIQLPRNICLNGQLNCGQITQVLSIIPSCDNCNGIDASSSKKHCYLMQAEATMCSFNNYFLPHMKCKKQNKGKPCEQCTAMFDGGSESSDSTNTQDASETETEKYNYGGKDKDCPPCHCPEAAEQTGVSAGLAVGLLILGIVIGTVVTAILCICVPSLRGRARYPGQRVTGKLTQNGIHGSDRPNQESDQRGADTTLPARAAAAADRVVPSAPPAAPQARYHTLDTVAHQRDSHTYTGIQPSEYNEPMDNSTYQDSKSRPVKGKNTVASPVYLELQDDNIISGSGNAKPTIQPVGSRDTSEMSNHNYFILEAENEAGRSDSSGQKNERPVSDHQYFVLEEQANSQTSKQKDDTDEDYHPYFVLEKDPK